MTAAQGQGPRAPLKLAGLARLIDLSAIVTSGAPPNPEFVEAHGWTVTLFRKWPKRQLTTAFYTGVALGEPTARQVLQSLILDARSVEDAGSFEQWASDLGFDPDSRRAERIYRACTRLQRKLRRFLDSDYELFLGAEE